MPDQCATCDADGLLFTCGYCDRQFCADHAGTHEPCPATADAAEAAGERRFEWGDAPPDDRATGAGADPFDEGGFRFEPVTADRPSPRHRGSATAAVERVPWSTRGETTPAVERVPRPADDRATPATGRAPRRVAGDAERAIERAPRDHVGVHVRAVRRPSPRTPTAPATDAVRPAPDPEPPRPRTGTASTDDASTDEPAVPIRPMDTMRSPGRVARHEPRTTTEWIRQQTYLSLTVKTALLAAAINAGLYVGMAVTVHGLI
jgi:hypothetical protein